jgi:hypothetical protein
MLSPGRPAGEDECASPQFSHPFSAIAADRSTGRGQVPGPAGMIKFKTKCDEYAMHKQDCQSLATENLCLSPGNPQSLSTIANTYNWPFCE